MTAASSFQTNSSAIIDRIFASEGVVNSAIPAYHLRDLIKRYHYYIYEMLLIDVPCEVLCLALGNLKPTPTTFFFFLNALVTVLVTSASIICVSNDSVFGENWKNNSTVKTLLLSGRNKRGADSIQMYLCNSALRGLWKRSS